MIVEFGAILGVPRFKQVQVNVVAFAVIGARRAINLMNGQVSKVVVGGPWSICIEIGLVDVHVSNVAIDF